MNVNLREKVSKDELRRFLGVRAEADQWDFKQTFSVEPKKGKSSAGMQLTTRARVELARDTLALANTPGGGHLILGVTKAYDPVGLADDVPAIDTESVADVIARFHRDVRIIAAEHWLEDPSWDASRRFALIYVLEYGGIAMALINGTYTDPEKGEVTSFKDTDILVRRNARTCLADAGDLARLRVKSSEPEQEREKQPLPDNLPRSEEIAPDFVGRARELEKLWAWFRDAYSRVWLLSGDGGKGKSALAYEFACEVRAVAPDGYYTVIWLSAKRRMFIKGQTRPIVAPDFEDLDGLIDAINKAYGYVYDADTPFEERRDHAVALLTELPALLVVDDIDSLASEHQNTYTFLMGLMRTPTKILFTSRRILFGLDAATIQVEGFAVKDGNDGFLFIESRLRRLRLDPALFPTRTRERILRATEGSPLFIEDLLRLSASCKSVEHAIAQWEKGDGDAAREYALKRELETLLPQATDILIACCLPDGPLSFAEIQNITGLSERRIGENLDELQQLFLVSSPRLIEDVQRFDVLANTRTLVRTVYAHTDQYRRLKEAYERIRGQQDIGARRDIGVYIRQASAQQALQQDEEAERTIKGALDRYPNHPDLIAQLGIIYLRWTPAMRRTDALLQFERAAQLGCRREAMYDQWAHAVVGRGEFSEGARVAKLGREKVGDTGALLYREGYARSRLGQDLRRSFHGPRAEQELEEADRLLRRALKDPETLSNPWERQLNRQVFMALVLNNEALNRIDDMYRLLRRWQAEYPDNPPQHALVARLESMHPKDGHLIDRHYIDRHYSDG